MKKMDAAKVWIWRILRPDIGMVVILSLISALIAGGMVLLALLSRSAIDRATGAAQGSFWWPGIGLLALVAAEALLQAVFNYLKAHMSGRAEIRIKDRLFDALFQEGRMLLL